MFKFRILINGVNCRIRNLDTGVVACMGFYVTAYVEAESATAAEFAAMDILRASPKLRESVLNPVNDPPRLFLDEIEHLEDWPVDCAMPLSGFAFYNEQESQTNG